MSVVPFRPRSGPAAPTPPLPGATAGAPSRALLVARLRMARNGFRANVRRRPGRTALRGLVVLPALGLLLALVFAAAVVTFRAVDEATAGAVLGLVFAAVVVGGFVGSASIALQAFYLASDLPLLHALPIPLRVIYGAKLAEAMVGTGPIAVVLAAVLAGHGFARGAGWVYPVVAGAVGLALLATVSSLGVLAVALVGRAVPARAARRFLGLIGLAVVALTWAVWRLIAPEAGAGIGDEAALRTVAAAGEALGWTPVGWAGRAVAAAGTGRAAPLAVYGGLFALGAGALILGAFAVFARSYAAGSARLRAATAPGPRRAIGAGEVRRGHPVARLLAPLPVPLAALVLKEWLTMGRDLRRLSGAVWPLGMVAVYAISLGRGDGGAPADAPGFAFWLATGKLLLVPWGASLGIAIYAFGTERRNVHLLRALPVAPRTILLAKTLASLLPILLVAEAATVVACLVAGASPGQGLGMAALVAWATIGYVVIDTAGAAIAPNFEADQVQRSTGLFGRIVGFVAGALFTLLSAVAAGRLILFATGVPGALRPALGREVFGIGLLGWPLVGFAAIVAALVVLAAFALAEDRLGRLMREGA